jgi:hypothetical protein
MPALATRASLCRRKMALLAHRSLPLQTYSRDVFSMLRVILRNNAQLKNQKCEGKMLLAFLLHIHSFWLSIRIGPPKYDPRSRRRLRSN